VWGGICGDGRLRPSSRAQRGSWHEPRREEFWGGKRESNPQPSEPQSGALPVELFPPPLRIITTALHGSQELIILLSLINPKSGHRGRAGLRLPPSLVILSPASAPPPKAPREEPALSEAEGTHAIVYIVTDRRVPLAHKSLVILSPASPTAAESHHAKDPCNCLHRKGPTGRWGRRYDQHNRLSRLPRVSTGPL
jgi:hypothetical protein